MNLEAFKDDVRAIQKRQRAFVKQQIIADASVRIAHLKQMKKMLEENETLWLQALQADLGKPAMEAYASEIGILLNEMDYTMDRLAKWLEPEVNRRVLLTGIEEATIYREPFGSVLVFAPWNYPLQLSLTPVIGALAAGNSVVLKPSESARAVSFLLKELVGDYFHPDVFHVIEGDADVADALTDLKWDFIFFTGSPAVGQQVYEKAAKQLTPVVLELGGKNPCIVDESGFTEETITQIVWGKFFNAGQTCIAPDTVYVPRSIYPAFLGAVLNQLHAFYGEHPKQSKDYGRIVHAKHLDKMKDFLKDGEILVGGDMDEAALYLAPTVMINPKEESAIRQEEIFGPILPIVPYDTIENVFEIYDQLPIPLVAYVFTEKSGFVKKVKDGLESSAVSVNQVLVHASIPNVPFGGKGESGLGNYHGAYSFNTFTHERVLYEKKGQFNVSLQFPPYKDKALNLLKRFRKWLY